MGKRLLHIILIIIILSLSGCANDDLKEKNNQINSEDLTGIAGDADIDIIEIDTPLESKEQLREKLLGAISVELKDTANSTIGILQENEKIVTLVDNLFKYKIAEDYSNNQKPQIVGPINFYFSDGADIYGLMYNQYIYIEGYYFVINKRISQDLQNLFRANVASAPINIE